MASLMMIRGGERLQQQNIQYETVHMSEPLSMVLNHSSTPIDLEQVEQTDQIFYPQAAHTEGVFKEETGSNLEKIIFWTKK